MTYEQFESAASELFGLEPYEIAVLAEQLVASGYDLDEISVRDKDFWAEASDFEAVDMALADVEDVPERYALDRYFPDDEYLDPGDVWEVSAEAYTD